MDYVTWNIFSYFFIVTFCTVEYIYLCLTLLSIPVRIVKKERREGGRRKRRKSKRGRGKRSRRKRRKRRRTNRRRGREK